MSNPYEEQFYAASQLYTAQTPTRGTVFSAKTSFNPTSLAVQASLKDIFDQLETIVTQELRITENDPEYPEFEKDYEDHDQLL